MSRPSRARGLKHLDALSTFFHLLSRPSRARGLKHVMSEVTVTVEIVAPFTGAWIETARSLPIGLSLCRALHGRVD